MTGEKLSKRSTSKPRHWTDWAQEEFNEAIEMGIMDGSNPMGLVPRYQAAIMAKGAVEKAKGK